MKSRLILIFKFSVLFKIVLKLYWNYMIEIAGVIFRAIIGRIKNNKIKLMKIA
mgnify:CR=1 FL=1